MISEEQFLQKALAQPNQWEYHQGELISLADESVNHQQIRKNLVNIFSNHENNSLDSLLFMPLADAYTYPDFMLLPEEVIIYEEPKQAPAILNPTLVVEIFSPQSKDVDTYTKWEYYQQINNLEQYLLIDEQRPLLQLFTRNGQGWKLEVIKDDEKKITICQQENHLTEIYQEVLF